MTHIGTLWGLDRQRQTKVILSVAALNDFKLDLPPFAFDAKPAEFLNKFPYGKIPAYESTDGFKLIEGTPIARYLGSIGTKVKLLGSNEKETATIDQWVHFAEHEIATPLYVISGQLHGFSPYNRETIDVLQERVVRALKYLESHLASRPGNYAALDTLTFADLILISVIAFAASVALGAAERAQYPHIFAYYAKVAGDERVKQYWGTDGFVEARLTEPIKA